MKVVLDTHVLLAALAARGLCEAVLEACLVGQEIISSEYILDEVRHSLAAKLKLPAGQYDEIVSFLRGQFTMVSPASVPAGSCRDPSDLPVLGTAAGAGAQFLVTGDRDLLEIKTFPSIGIVSPREFHDQLA